MMLRIPNRGSQRQATRRRRMSAQRLARSNDSFARARGVLRLWSRERNRTAAGHHERRPEPSGATAAEAEHRAELRRRPSLRIPGTVLSSKTIPRPGLYEIALPTCYVFKGTIPSLLKVSSVIAAQSFTQ